MPTEPNTPQPVIPFPTPNFTPVLDGPSPVVPESVAFLSLQQHLTEKANLEFVPVKARSLEQRARLVFVRQQCEELEKVVVLERMAAQIANLRQEIKALRARRRKFGPITARNRKQHLAAREVIQAKQAECTKLEESQAQLNGIAQVTELSELTRNQFLKMVGMTVLATVIWNRAAAGESNGASSWTPLTALGSASCSSFSSQGAEDFLLYNGERVDIKVTSGQYDRPDDALTDLDKSIAKASIALVKASNLVWHATGTIQLDDTKLKPMLEGSTGPLTLDLSSLTGGNLTFTFEPEKAVNGVYFEFGLHRDDTVWFPSVLLDVGKGPDHEVLKLTIFSLPIPNP